MKRGYFVFVLIILLIGIISATYTFVDHSIETEYGPRETLSGWVEIGFTEESAASLFESSVDGKTSTISLLKLVKADTSFLYDCPAPCSSNYEATEESSTKDLILDNGESALLGFKFEGVSISDISDFSIDITSSAGASYSPQLKIDVLNNEEDVWQVHTASGNFGEQDFGCYTSGDARATITSTEYCERITVPAAPNVKLGAKLIGTGDATFKMNIESMDGGEYGFCEFSVSVGGEYGCIAFDSETKKNFSVNEEKEYFVCISKIEGYASYEINTEDNNFCGFAGNFKGGYTIDFEIFMEPGEYVKVESFTLNETEVQGIDGYVKDYVEYIYYNDCPAEGCIIPLKITSFVDAQTIHLSNALIKYSHDSINVDANKLYNLAETPATITATEQQLSLDTAGFTVPIEYDDYTLRLEFDGKELFSEEITIEKVPIILSLIPSSTAVAYPTPFTVNVDSDTQIESYEWDFGDGHTDTTTTNKITYTYNTLGTYALEVTVKDTVNKSATKNFTITVGSASIVMRDLLQEKRTNLDTLKNQIKSFSLFERNSLEKALNLDTIETTLIAAENAEKTATTEADYQIILQDLIEMNLPKSVSLSLATNDLLFFADKTNINVDALASITSETYESSKKERYASAVLGWSVQNIDTTLTHNTITATFETYEENLLNTFEVIVTKKERCEEEPYIVIKKIEGLTFAEDYSEEEVSGYFYIPIVGESKKIVFATTEDVDFLTLPLFVSPAISELSLTDIDLSPVNDSGELKKWVLFSLIMLLLIIVGITFWIILNAWYKKRYENYLFKNKNHLYNLFNWIKNSKKRGVKEGNIRSQLRKSGWSSEQSKYALKKYSGKRIGMPKLPFTKKKEGVKNMPQGKMPQKTKLLKFKRNNSNKQPKKGL